MTAANNYIVSSSFSSVHQTSFAGDNASNRKSVKKICAVVEVLLLALFVFSENCDTLPCSVFVEAMMTTIREKTTTTTTTTMTTTYFENTEPHSYKEGEIVELKVNTLTSTKDLYPMDYYRLPYCVPEGGIRLQQQNLGEYLTGDWIQNSPYVLKMKTDMYCEQLCISNLGWAEQPYTTANTFVKAIRNNYRNNWIVDNLPPISLVRNDESYFRRSWGGFPIGFVYWRDQKAYIYNHVSIVIEYHAEETMNDTYRIVRFTVEPFSIAHDIRKKVGSHGSVDIPDNYHSLPKLARIESVIPSCDPEIRDREHIGYDMLRKSEVKPQLASGEVLFTYDVIWKENPNLVWASRWDIYLSMNNAIPAKVHLASIMNSILLLVCMSVLLISRWIAILRRSAPITNPYDYKLIQDEDDNETVNETGWRAVRLDVFRPPLFSPMLLAVGCGTGAQLLCTTIVTVWLAYLGFLKAPNRGYLLLCLCWSYSIFGCINGCVTARYYKAFGGKEQGRTTTIAAFGLPGITFTFFMMLECIAILKETSYAPPFTIILTLVVWWAGISVPLVFIGASWGYDQDAIEYPVATNTIPREIPKQPFYTSSLIALGLCGVIPLSVCYVELYYITSSIWMGCYYDGYGYLLIVIFLGFIAVAEQAIYCTYTQLNHEDYHWWWRAFWNGGSVGIYIFLYSFRYFPNLEVSSLASFIFYYGCMGLVSLAIFAMMGFVGVSSSLYFNKVLYTSIKTD